MGEETVEFGEAAFFVVQPSNALAMLFLIGTILMVWRIRVGAIVLALTGLTYAGLGLLPVGNGALRLLEERFEPSAIEAPPHGIILLGGHHLTPRYLDPLHVPLNAHGERLTTAAALAKRYPEAKLIVTDGGKPLSGAKLSEMVLRELGIGDDQLVVEYESLSTYDNAVLTRNLVQPKPGERYVLVTSAWHMPRSVATFRAAGWPEPLAFPVDHVTDHRPVWFAWNKSAADGLRLVDLAAREYLALLAYYLAGRTTSLFPHQGLDGPA